MPSITRRRSPNPGRRASVEADVLAATQRLLSDGTSFTELGVQQIAQEAGVARSTFYSHFTDKTDLIMRLATAMVDTVFTVASPWKPSDGVDGLADVYLKLMALYRERAAVLGAIAEVATYDATVRGFWNEGLNRFIDHTVGLVRDEQDAGRTPAAVDAVSASRLIIVGGERSLFDHITTQDSDHDDAFARELALTWWHGLYRRPSS